MRHGVPSRSRSGDGRSGHGFSTDSRECGRITRYRVKDSDSIVVASERAARVSSGSVAERDTGEALKSSPRTARAGASKRLRREMSSRAEAIASRDDFGLANRRRRRRDPLRDGSVPAVAVTSLLRLEDRPQAGLSVRAAGSLISTESMDSRN